MDSLRDLLCGWGLDGATAQRFIDEEWTVETLNLLKECDLVPLIPKQGPRRRFEAKLEAFKQENQLNLESIIVVMRDLPGPSSSVPSPSSPAEPSSPPSSDPCIVNADCNGSSLNADCTNPSSTAAPGSAEPARKRRRITPSNAVEELLSNSFEGKLVLAEYATSKQLNNDIRDSLVQIVVYNEFRNDYNTHLTASRFNDLANDIVLLFTSEAKETYFHSYERKKKLVSAGRLVVKYHNTRRKLIHCNLISKTTLADEQLLIEHIDFGDELDDLDEDTDLRWLSTNVRPWKNVMEAWDRSFANRCLITGSLATRPVQYTGKQIECVYDYLVAFPALAETHGWELLCSDFDRNFPGKDQCLSNVWSSLVQFCVAKLVQSKGKATDITKLSESELAVHVLLNFAQVFKVRTITKSKPWRLTKAEIQQGFVLHAQNDVDWVIPGQLRPCLTPTPSDLSQK